MSFLPAPPLTFVLFTRVENTKNTAEIGQILALAIERALYPVPINNNHRLDNDCFFDGYAAMKCCTSGGFLS